MKTNVDFSIPPILANPTPCRADSTSLAAWEALADSYLARGSYTAARKAFQRVLELSPGAAYPRLMVAGIKLKQGELREAVEDYRAIQEDVPSSLAALRGEAEAQVALGRSCLEQNLDQAAVECVEGALRAGTRAALVRPGLAGTWRLLGEAGGLVAGLGSEVVGEVRVQGELLHQDGPREEVVDRGGLLQLATRCYSRALALAPGSPGLWHELGLLYSSLGDSARALGALRQAVALGPSQAGLWGALGAELARQEQWAGAQHSLVRSLQLEASATAWSNLGAVYLSLGHHTLANRAFREAQAGEPDWVRGWAGQALVAEAAGYRGESLDLLRHCTFLGQEEESARGYGEAVTRVLAELARGEEGEAHSKYIVERMWGARVGVDSLTRHTARRPEDATALCQLALLQERLGLVRGALRCLQRAGKILQGGPAGHRSV